MSSIVLLLNGRRHPCKVTPNTILGSLLSEVCSKSGIDPSEYELRSSQGKSVDLSLPFRLTGVSNNATLEICKLTSPRFTTSNNEVEIAVQIGSGDRIMVCSKLSVSMWDFLQTCQQKVPETNLFLSADPEKAPCLAFMGNNFIGEKYLRRNTLSGVGIKSRALLRHSFETAVADPADDGDRSTEVAQTNQSTIRKDAEGSAGSGETHKTSFAAESPVYNNIIPDNVQGFSWMPDFKPGQASKGILGDSPVLPPEQRPERFANFKFPENKSLSSEASTSSTLPSEKADRKTVVFSLEEFSCEVEDVPDSFFEITTEDLRTMQKLRKKEVEMLNEKPLMTQDLRKSQISEKFGKETKLRIIFPDRFVIQANFNLHEPVSNLYEYVKSYLVANIEKFELFVTPPRKVVPVSSTKTFLDLELYPAVNIHMSTGSDEQQYLSAETLAMKASPASVLGAQSCSNMDSEPIDPAKTENSSSRGGGEFTASKSTKVASTSPDKIPKWFTQAHKK